MNHKKHLAMSENNDQPPVEKTSSGAPDWHPGDNFFRYWLDHSSHDDSSNDDHESFLVNALENSPIREAVHTHGPFIIGQINAFSSGGDAIRLMHTCKSLCSAGKEFASTADARLRKHTYPQVITCGDPPKNTLRLRSFGAGTCDPTGERLFR